MAGIVGGVAEHLGREGTLRPVGPLVRFGKLHSNVLFEQGCEADGGFAGELRGDARIEQGGGPKAVIAIEDAEVVVGVVEYLLHGGVGQQLADGVEVGYGEGIDDRCVLRGGQLHQIDAVEVLVETCRLGVDRDEGVAAKGCNHLAKRLVCGYVAIHRSASGVWKSL